MLKKLFAPERNSLLTDLGLLALRCWLALTMLLNHGMGKLMGFSTVLSKFPDPIGIGVPASLGLAVFAEVFCSALLILGLLTRFALLNLTATMVVAFFLVHQSALSGERSGELAFIYLAGFVGLLFAGPGRFSIDAKLFSK